ncbi:hypothetical protein EIP86_001290 [Pleurotus ostreatoroseus]|nr:hypothetical protein EIP86_001290 [Pleurotus ostreatoroseus]
MSPDHLRVLQSEQSSGHLSGLAEQKDHFKHISPLSMVGDRKMVRRRRSWRDTLRVITSPVNEKPPSPRALRSGISIPSPKAGPYSAPVKSHGRMYTQHQLSTNALDEAGSLADEEDGADLSAVPEEDKPIQARVRFNPVISQQQLQQSPKESEDDATLVSLTDEPMPLGTRLTMTSRTGYFQDRVISPSMMRAMAILFIGPHRNPDFAHDYHLSPVLAPSRLLAQFPPLLMTCGEKDPFVDDTVIFAGRVREAKRARRKELEAALTGRTAMFGEHLRMSLHDTGRDDASLRAMKRELDELAGQTEEDWVQMHIFSEWSHGYMQMSRLMPEACTVITDLADWIDGVFEGRRGRSVGRRSSLSKGRVAKLEKAGLAATDDVSTPFASETEVETETDDPLTFAPKKRSPPNSFSTSRDSRDPLTPTSRPRQSSRGTSSKRPMDWQDGGVAETVNSAVQPGSMSVTQDILHGTAIAFSPATGGSVARVVSPASAQRVPSPTRNGKAASPAKAGQKISESELMRRRRLLDSHLISSDSPPR